MCLILFAWRVHPEFPLVFAGNRDEAYERPSSAAGWTDDPQVFGGRDLEKGGTWLGMTRGGRFAAVTNYREGRTAAKTAAHSRGELTANFLRSTVEPQTYVEIVAMRSTEFNGFTLLVGDLERMYCTANRGSLRTEEVTPGVHGLSNHLLDTPWPKVKRGKERLSGLMKADEAGLVRGLFDALADRTVAHDAELPDTGVGFERERELSCAFIAGERYGTRASTVLLVSRDGEVLCEERRFGARGSPLGETTQRFPLYMRASGRNTKAAGQDV
jgi:uncharacterized protein with NRDE domain